MRIRCACGWEAAGDEDTVVAATQDHGRKLHNMEASRDQVVAMAIVEADPDGAPPGPA